MPTSLGPQTRADPALTRAILRLLVSQYGGLSCAPNLANHFASISNGEMQEILEDLVDGGVLRRVTDPELCELIEHDEQTLYQLK